MTVKEIVNLLPNRQPFRLEIDNLWEELITKDDCVYNRIMEEYGDYNVIEIEACDNGVYDYATLWLKVEKTEYDELSNKCEDDNHYKILSYSLFLFEESKFKYLETYKHYTILKASLNPHNSEYIIKELGFNVRWASLIYCKKYIREQLNIDKGE